ncbi:MAG: EVE domain-containing protein [Bacteroidetes bacterium]|nr:EVE domain-containing protein [Bacteroidota bacterium]
MTKDKRMWLIKSEPNVYSFDNLIQDKHTSWTGVRNYGARNNLRAMKKGDEVLFYHSNIGKAIVGLAKIVKEAYQDPTTEDKNWVCVDVAAVKKLKTAITLEDVKSHPGLVAMDLVRLGRLSVQTVKNTEFDEIIKMSNE